MTTVETVPAAAEVPTRAQVKEACRLAFVSGQAKLAELSARHGIPYQTLREWSMQGEWGQIKAGQQEQLQTESKQNLEKWLQEERQRQTQRALERAQRLHKRLDGALEDDKPLKPSDLRDLATAEDKVDVMIRRTLGMDDQGGSQSGKVSVNILSSLVQIANAG